MAEAVEKLGCEAAREFAYFDFAREEPHQRPSQWLAAAKRGDYATALKEWRPLAEQGHAKAQFFLGLMFRRGQGVQRDYAEAVKWWRKGARQGHANAQNNLGEMYGVMQDYAKALKWHRKAALQGQPILPRGSRIQSHRQQI